MIGVPKYQVVLTTEAQKDLAKLDKAYSQAAQKALHKLEQNPSSGKRLIRELAGNYRLRFSRYRIIYEVNRANKLVIVHTIDHRKDVYR